MKKLFLILTTFIVSITVFTSPVSAQGMMNWFGNYGTTSSSISSTVQEEAEGKAIWEQLQSKQLKCKNLTDDDFDVLGEYFMVQSIGNTERHALMNQMMKNMMGEKGETQIHITLGKRSSGCDTNALFLSGYGFMPMMWWMMGYGGWGDFGLGWIFMIIFWVLIIFGVVALVRYLGGQRNTDKGKTSLEILKECYAKGEIDKKEFEDKKKDLGS